jgi:hypothetical protein
MKYIISGFSDLCNEMIEKPLFSYDLIRFGDECQTNDNYHDI